MSIGREIKRRVRSAIPSVVLLAIAAYFGWSATQGEHGLKKYAEQQSQLILARADLAQANSDLDVWERRVAGLRGTHLDPDALEEQARHFLNLADTADIVVLYPAGKKLFEY